MSNILIIGGGGREHALYWKLKQSPKVDTVYVSPGNAGTPNTVDLGIDNYIDASAFCLKKDVEMVIIGPEVPLCTGIVDRLRELNSSLMVFGPIKEGARLETSKIYSKEFMKEFHLPTADFVVVNNQEDSDKFFENNKWNKMVVKADGLAAGKGVVLPNTTEEAKNVVKSMLKGQLGTAGKKLVIEECLEGYEVSALAFVDGVNFRRMPLARDHKRLLEGDVGPNTGGMGAVAPVHLPMEIDSKIDKIFSKTLGGLQRRGINYCGILYAGIMVVNKEPYLLEYNCRFGDPEAQVLMRLLESDLYDICKSCVHQSLETCEMVWSTKNACGVVLASPEYPVKSDSGSLITDIPKENSSTVVFHAGTKTSEGKVMTNGGRILCVTSVGDHLSEARKTANQVADQIQFNGKQFRKDIGETLELNKFDLSYGQSGVSIEEGNKFVEDIKGLVKKTLLPGTSQIGGFGAVLNLSECGFPEKCDLVVGIDGVGTKIEIASCCNNYSGIGYDVVAMCVNDVICHCAKPIAFLDYFVTGKLDRKMATEVLASISAACIEAECSLIGGETAEMPGVYNPNQWDLAGCAVACRQPTWPCLPLSSEIVEGDVIIGISSSGVHSNGFSLVRKILQVNGVSYKDPTHWDHSITYGEELLRGTKIYVNSVLPLLVAGLVKGCAHITGGGIAENAIRVLDKNSEHKLVIDCTKWSPPEIFNWMAASGPVEIKEMLKTFNCGIGMVLIVSQKNVEEVQKLLNISGEKNQIIGNVQKRTNDNLIDFVNESRLFNGQNYTRHQNNRVKVGILISGAGTNMKKLIERSKVPGSNCEVVVVVSNKENAGGLKIAREMNVPTKVVHHTDDRLTGDIALSQTLDEYGVELICLGGYMRILSEQFVKKYPKRIINIHPSLLPAFKGAHALQDALEFGAKVVGCTAHFVDEMVDHGEIIAQKAVQVEKDDDIQSVRANITREEHILFPNAMIKVAADILKH